MPHLVVLYTRNLEAETDIGALCRTLADAMLAVKDESGAQVFPTGGTRVLAYPAAHFAVADRKPDPVRLVVERGGGDHLRLNRAVDPERLRLLEVHRLADLGRGRLDLALKRAGVVAQVDLALAHGAGRSYRAAEVARAESAEAEDQQGHERPDDGAAALPAAQGVRHGVRFPR